MENQLIKVITDSKVEQSTALTLQNAFLPAYDQLTVWAEKAKTLVVTDKSQTREMKMAREARLALKEIRVNANKTRLALKEDSTRYGKAVQSVYNLIEGLITPAEKHLETQEKFVEIQEEKRKKNLWSIRASELLHYRDFVTPDQFAELGEMTEEEFQDLLKYCGTALENKMAEETQAELDRIEKERKKAERQEKMFALGLKWNGSEFIYKDINFHWTDILCMVQEEFDKAYEGAKLRKERLDLEEQAAARAERFSQTTPIVEVSYTEVKSTIGITDTKPKFEPIKHPFHCFLCGAKLTEIGLGGLECEDCLTIFIPFLDQEGNQCLASQK